VLLCELDLARLQFAVVDVETTGLFARAHDRVIEVGVVITERDGEELGRYETLVNPGRDLGPTEIHGVRGRDVLDAPTFADLLGDLSVQLGGRILVAHNARFDRDFLGIEFARCGFSFPEVPWLCTMEIGAALTGFARLASCCEQLDIALARAHAAVDDAAAAAAVLACWLRLPESQERLELLLRTLPIPPAASWPQVEASGRNCLRSSPRPQQEPTFIGSLLSRLPPGSRGVDGAGAAYLELLDRALEDRRLTSEETEALHDLAVGWGLGRADVEVLHRDYMIGLASLAWQDGRLTEAERADLEDAASSLGIAAEVLAELITAPLVDGQGPLSALPQQSLAGKSVCFTGQLTCTIGGLPITRAQAQELAAGCGLHVQDSVTKKLDLLVVADPESLSGKARKARDYGARILVERSFWRDIGVAVD
jgi:DNA polymerase III subunit epsilon